MGCSEQYFINSRMRKCYTIFILLLPVTTIYASPIPLVSYGEIIMLLLIGIIIFDMALKRKLVLTKSPFLIYLLYACLATIVSGVIFTVITGEYSMTDSIQRMLRDVFYFSMALFFAPISFDFDYGIRIMRKIIFITGVFIFIQFIVYSSLHVYIPGIIPWMKTTISCGVTGGD